LIQGLISANLAINLPIRQLWWELIDAHSMHTCIPAMVFGVRHLAAVATKAGEAKVQEGAQFEYVITAKPAVFALLVQRRKKSLKHCNFDGNAQQTHSHAAKLAKTDPDVI